MAPIRESLEDVVVSLGELSAHERATVTIARAVADELDGGQTANAALVKQYRDLLWGLADVESDDPSAALLALVRDEASA